MDAENVEQQGQEEFGQDREQRLEQERARLLEVVSASAPDTLQHKVAWVLNNYPEARNSDISLQLKYWETFHPDQYNSGYITADTLYRLPRLTSLTRARARIQNQLKLFQADSEVQRHRGTLEEDEREKAREQSAAYPVYAVYLDESGKTQQYILVGSLWILHGPETWRIAGKLREWRHSTGFHHELHFADVQSSNLNRYKEAVDIVVRNASALSFKVISVLRAGAGAVQDVIAKLMFYLLLRGIEHEDSTGRATLPRNLQVWKDAEEAGYDSMVLADLRERLKAASTTHFGGKLVVDTLQSARSAANDLIQIADVFTGSVNRVINPPDPQPAKPGPKDELAQYVLAVLHISLGGLAEEQCEDIAVRLEL